MPENSVNVARNWGVEGKLGELGKKKRVEEIDCARQEVRWMVLVQTIAILQKKKRAEKTEDIDSRWHTETLNAAKVLITELLIKRALSLGVIMKPLNKLRQNYSVLWLCQFLVVFQCGWNQSDTRLVQTQWEDHLFHQECWRFFLTGALQKRAEWAACARGSASPREKSRRHCARLGWNGAAITSSYLHL